MKSLSIEDSQPRHVRIIDYKFADIATSTQLVSPLASELIKIQALRLHWTTGSKSTVPAFENRRFPVTRR